MHLHRWKTPLGAGPKACPDLRGLRLEGDGIVGLGPAKSPKACPDLRGLRFVGDRFGNLQYEGPKACPDLRGLRLAMFKNLS